MRQKKHMRQQKISKLHTADLGKNLYTKKELSTTKQVKFYIPKQVKFYIPKQLKSYIPKQVKFYIQKKGTSYTTNNGGILSWNAEFQEEQGYWG